MLRTFSRPRWRSISAAAPPTSPASGEVKLLIHMPPPGGFAADLPGERGGEAADPPSPPGGFAADLPGERGGEAADPPSPPGGFAADLPGERGGEAL